MQCQFTYSVNQNAQIIIKLGLFDRTWNFFHKNKPTNSRNLVKHNNIWLNFIQSSQVQVRFIN